MEINGKKIDKNTEQKLLAALEGHKEEAKKLLEDEDKLEDVLKDIENKLKSWGKAGELLSNVPVLVSLVRSYIRKEYTEFPLSSLLAVIAGLLYVINPFDIIPDQIPLIGQVDDALVIALVLKLTATDVAQYQDWKTVQSTING